MQYQDIPWNEHLNDALALARTRRHPVLVMPLGQGMGCADDW
jgi:hypothetical protein